MKARKWPMDSVERKNWLKIGKNAPKRPQNGPDYFLKPFKLVLS